MDSKSMAAMIDHTNLHPQATGADIEKLCCEAVLYHFKAVCVNPRYVKFAAQRLENTGVIVCTVVGFPLGAGTTGTKIFETKEAVGSGAGEIDMVINIGALTAHEDRYVYDEIRGVVQAAGDSSVKVIIEACFLSAEEKERACRLAIQGGAAFVKTSTGFGSGGATREDVALMRKTVSSRAGVKASGGIRDIETMLAMVEAGASRIGTSSGVKIITGNSK